MTAPTSGMNAPRNTSEANGSASGTPMIARPVPMPTASTSATRNGRPHVADQRAEAGPARVAHARRTCAGKTLVTNAKMLRPPCSRKISVNSTSSAPVTISVTVPAVDSAPLVSFS